jgi:hypothetical protein
VESAILIAADDHECEVWREIRKNGENNERQQRDRRSGNK